MRTYTPTALPMHKKPEEAVLLTASTHTGRHGHEEHNSLGRSGMVGELILLGRLSDYDQHLYLLELRHPVLSGVT